MRLTTTSPGPQVCYYNSVRMVDSPMVNHRHSMKEMAQHNDAIILVDYQTCQNQSNCNSRLEALIVSVDVVEDGARLPRSNLFTLDLKTPRL